MDSRPGSTTSLLRTVLGIYLRELGGWIAVSSLLELMDALDVPAPISRTALARVKKRGLVLPEVRGKAAGYRIADDAVRMLARGDRRIYHPRTMPSDGRWCAISFSIPEEQRAVRHQLRRRLRWIGCGTVSSALWICPAYLTDEVIEILDDLGVREHTTVLVTERPIVAGELVDAVRQWWDLDALAEHHREFVREHGSDLTAPDATVTPREAFAHYIRAIDAWRIIPYIDPGLPADLLPADWPGEAGNELMREIRRRYSRLATEYVAQVTGASLDDPARVAVDDIEAWKGRGR